MYEAKKSGANQYSVYSQYLSQQTVMMFSLEHELRHAIKNQQLELYYQPKIFNYINNGIYNLAGAEALLRWHHPTQGLICPNVFIPIAEESGLIIQIGEWVVENACKQLRIFHNPFSDLNN